MLNEEIKTKLTKIVSDQAEISFIQGILEGLRNPPPPQHKDKVIEHLEIRALALEQIVRKESKDIIKNLPDQKHFVYASKN